MLPFWQAWYVFIYNSVSDCLGVVVVVAVAAAAAKF